MLNPNAQCKPLKDRGIIVSVLYVPYQPIQNSSPAFAGDEDDYANNNITNIPASLQSCASPGFFYTANSPADIACRTQRHVQSRDARCSYYQLI